MLTRACVIALLTLTLSASTALARPAATPNAGLKAVYKQGMTRVQTDLTAWYQRGGKAATQLAADAHDTVQKLLHAKPTDDAGSILQDEAEQGFGAYSDIATQMATADAADACKLVLGKSAALNRELGGKAAVAFHRYLIPSGELAGYDDTVLQAKLYPSWLKGWVKGNVGPRASLPRCN